MTACKSPLHLPQGGVRSDTVYQTRYVLDSIYTREVRTWQVLNDTVYCRDTVRMIRLRTRTDTVFTHRVDSVPYPVEVERIVERKRNWLDYMGYISILALVAIFVLKMKGWLAL